MSQDNESDLAPHPHRIRLHCALGGVRFPPLCANCGADATQRLRCTKAFRRATGDDTPDSHVVSSMEVPYCDACIARHQAETKPPSVSTTLLSGFGAGGDMLGAVALGIAAVFTGYLALTELFRARWSACALFAGISLVFGLLARLQAKTAWQNTAHLRVLPQSSVTLAFDFGDCSAGPFETERFLCTMRDARFAAAFNELNRDLEYRPDSAVAMAEQRAGQRKLWLWALVFVVVAVLFEIRNYLK
jgi:hypothetical protein